MLSAVSFAGSYSQDFNTLPHAGTSFFYGGLTDLDARPIDAVGMAGWQLHKSAGQSDFVTFIADGGNSAASSMRSFGGVEAPERALGSIANELGSYAYGVTLTNDTGGTLTSFTLTFAGEQWQESGSLAAQLLRFEYAIGEGVSIEQGTFVAAPALDFSAPQHGGTIRTLDGNDPANRTVITATISGIAWAPGTELALRWSDDDAADADHGLGIDDLTLTASPLNLTSPVFTAGADQTFAVPENSPSGTFVGLAAATDPDAPVEPLSYSIIAGDPTGAFAIDASGQLTIADAALLDLDFDFDNGEQVAVLTVQVSDGLHTVEQAVTVNVSPLNDNAPVFAAGASQTLSIDENSLTGAIVGLATATDADLPAETLVYSIIDGDPANAFAIDSNGQLTIADAALLDLDFDNGEQVAILTIQATDGTNPTTQTVTVNVLPLNDNPPAFMAGATQTFSIDENSLTGAILGQTTATDVDLPAETLAYSILAGDPTNAFSIDSSGQLTIADAALLDLDYENGDQVAVLTIQATDGANATTQTVTVNVLPLNDNVPQFTTAASLAVDENSVDVAALAATDADLPSQTLAFTIIGGADAALFTITNGNELKLLAGLDFESPTDSDADGVYLLEVQVDDGAGGIAALSLAISVNDVDETPPPFMAFARSSSPEEVEALDEAFGEESLTDYLAVAALLT